MDKPPERECKPTGPDVDIFAFLFLLLVAMVVFMKTLKQISASHINIATQVRSAHVLIGATHHRKKRTE